LRIKEQETRLTLQEHDDDDKNPSDRTMALGSTQPVTEMSTRSIS